MGTIIKDSLTNRVREVARKLGEFSVQKLFDEVAPIISSAHAAARAKSQIEALRRRRKLKGAQPATGGCVKNDYTVDELVHKGRVTALNTIIGNLLREGSLQRTSPEHYIFVNEEVPPALTKRVMEELEKRGACSVSLLTHVLGPDIADAQALHLYQKHLARERQRRNIHHFRNTSSLLSLIAHGKRRLIGRTLKHLCKRGRIQRVSKGVYAPLVSVFPPPTEYNHDRENETNETDQERPTDRRS